MPTINQVKEALMTDSVSKKNGVFTVRRGFFYTSGRTSDNLVAHIKSVYPDAVVLDHGEVWKNFNGGASVANQSHWWVKFTL